ncbi:unnamed protein product, partial [marine sediment metagenome]
AGTMRPGKIAGGSVTNYADCGRRFYCVGYPCDVLANDTSYYEFRFIGLRYD